MSLIGLIIIGKRSNIDIAGRSPRVPGPAAVRPPISHAGLTGRGGEMQVESGKVTLGRFSHS